MGIAIDYNLHRATVDIAKGFRNLQKADTAFNKDNIARSANDLSICLDYFATAADHIAKAEDDAYNEAGDKINDGNKELKKCIDACANGDVDKAQRDYDSAMNQYDKALDIIGA